VESALEGILKQWLVDESESPSVGEPIAGIKSETGVAEDDSFAQDVTPAPRDSSPASLSKYKVWLPRVPESQVPSELRLSFNTGKMAMFAQPGTPQSFLF
jgi:hypothetical protein